VTKSDIHQKEIMMDEKFKAPGAFSWFELMTNDIAAAKDFYSKLFGWTTEDMPMGGDRPYTVIKVNDEAVAGVMDMPPDAQGMPPMWGVYVTVDDVDATAKKAQDLGGKIIMPPKDIPDVGRFCVIQDQQGATIAAISYVEM
jgi:predicted enzyme related to lactoylglutathione lyase